MTISVKRQKLPYGAIYLASGFSSLALETWWIHDIALRFGGTVLSSSIVISVFFLASALGAALAARALARVRRPLLAYGALEAAFGVASLAAFALRDPLQARLGGGAGAAAAYALVLLGLPCALAGALFPLIAAAFVRTAGERRRVGGGFYAANLAGAALGVAGGGFALPAAFGYRATFLGVAAGSLALGAVAMLLSRRESGTAPAPAPSAGPAPRAPLAITAASGFLVIGLELACMQLGRQAFSNSIVSSTAVLFAFVLDLGIAAWVASRLRSAALLPATAAAGLASLSYAWLLHPSTLATAVRGTSLWSPSPEAAFALAAAAFFPLLLPAGMVFPLAWELLRPSDPSQGRALALAATLNKLGAAAGAALVPLLAFPAVGASAALAWAGAVYLAGAAWLARGAAIPRLAALAAAAVCAATALLLPPPVALPQGVQLLDLRESAYGVTAVGEDAAGSRHVYFNQSYMLNGTGPGLPQLRSLSWVPLALAPSPGRTAFIGGGSGISPAAALDFPVTELHAIELIPEVARAAREHFAAWNHGLFADSRAHVTVNDGRVALREAGGTFDLIITDLFFPTMEGTGALYSREFIAAARARLSPGGTLCLWLPLYQLGPELLDSVVHTFAAGFPHAIAVRGGFSASQAALALMGSNAPFDLSRRKLDARASSPELRRLAAERAAYSSADALRTLVVADLRDETVRALFAGAPENTEDKPFVTFRGHAPVTRENNSAGWTYVAWAARLASAQRAFPSLRLGAREEPSLRAAIRAGGLYVEASAWRNLALGAGPGGGDPEARRDQVGTELDPLTRARAALPSVSIAVPELKP